MKEKSKEEELKKVIIEIRKCCNHLKTLSGQLLGDLGINPSMRGVMESLFAGKRMTVPEIAEQKGVTRQHIQNISNALLAKELIEMTSNSAHRRSQHLMLTAKGQELFGRVRKIESLPAERVASPIPMTSLSRLHTLLSELNDSISKETERGGTDEKQS